MGTRTNFQTGTMAAETTAPHMTSSPSANGTSSSSTTGSSASAPSPSQAAYPTAEDLAEATRTHRQGAFAIATRKLPISKAGPIEAMEAALGIPVPEMIFGDNLVSVRHEPTGFAVEFAARDALDAVDKTGRHMLQVAHARDWSRSREGNDDTRAIMEVVRPFDWSYSTTYRGTVRTPGVEQQQPPAPPPPPPAPPQGAEDGDVAAKTQEQEQGEQNNGANGSSTSGPLGFRPTTKGIPIELLKRRDPILFFDEVTLYESELDDNGVSVLSAKVRVHERRMLLLCRLFMRLDGVALRVRDTRIYVDFDAEEITREYTAREGSFEDTKRVSK